MLTKSAHFLPMKISSTLDKLAKLYVNKIMTRQGVPISIVSYRDPRFISRFLKGLQKVLDTNLSFSIAFYPQIDG